jgi:hypothetical protein
VHDARPLRIADRGDIRKAREQAVGHRSAGVARSGVHDETGGFRNHDYVVVGVANVYDHVRVGLGDRVEGRLLEHLDHRTRDEPVALAHLVPVDHDRAATHERLHVGAAPAGQQRDRAVDPLAREDVGYDDRLTHDAGSRLFDAGCVRNER